MLTTMVTGGAGSRMGIILFSQFFCKFKTALKIKIYFLKRPMKVSYII
jgi:hypothetical protein